MNLIDFINNYTFSQYSMDTIPNNESVGKKRKASSIEITSSLQVFHQTITSMFQNQLPENLAELRENSALRAHMFSVAKNLEENFKLDLSSIFSAHVFANVESIDETIPISLNDYETLVRNVPYFHNAFEKSFLESTRKSISFFHPSEDIKNYIFYSKNRSHLPNNISCQALLQLILFADFLTDIDLINQLMPLLTRLLSPVVISEEDFLQIYTQLLTSPYISSQENLQNSLAQCANRYIKNKAENEIFLLFKELSDHFKINDLDLKNLNLSNCIISNELLESLSHLFPSVETLKICGTPLTTFHLPKSWRETLTVFDASNAKDLIDISSLDNLPHLKFLYLNKTKIERAPRGCSALITFSAERAVNLLNISGLDNLMHLRSLVIDSTLVTQSPIGCVNLEKFSAMHAKNFTDISGLDHLKNLIDINVQFTPITRAPIGCIKLERFVANEAIFLIDISGLENLQNLQEIHINSSLVDRIPDGLVNLILFSANSARQLQDISRFNDLAQLKSLFLHKTLIRQAPVGCSRLKEFHASNLVSFDISSLDDLSSIEEINLENTPIARAPRRCFNLKKFYANDSATLADVSGLDNLECLEEISLDRTAILRVPHNCINLIKFSTRETRTLMDISGLNDLKKLAKLDIHSTPVQNKTVVGCPMLKQYKEIDENYHHRHYTDTHE